MNGKTHLAFSMGIAPVAAGCIYQEHFACGCVCIAACIIGGLMPDIDNFKSMIGQKVELLSRTINKMFGHRGFIHSPLFMVGIYFLFKWLIEKYSFELYGFPILYGFLIGYGGHLLLDFMTKGGVPLLYPISKKKFKLTFMKSGKSYEGIVAGGVYSIVTICFLLLSALPI